MISLKTIYHWANLFFKNNPKHDLKYLIMTATNTNQTDYMNNIKIGILKVIKLKYFLVKYCFNKNVYHITHQKTWLDLELYVNKHVLVPRFETESLIEHTKKLIDKYKIPLNIIDIGTGSGAIALAMKKIYPQANVTGIDISKKALKVAIKNMANNNLVVNLLEKDLFKDTLNGYNIIISNPPYISKHEQVDSIVHKTEPHLALYADNDGLACYEAILKNYQNIINKPTLFAFEIGYNQKDAINQLIKRYYPKAKVVNKKDFNNLNRFIFAIIE